MTATRGNSRRSELAQRWAEPDGTAMGCGPVKTGFDSQCSPLSQLAKTGQCPRSGLMAVRIGFETNDGLPERYKEQVKLLTATPLKRLD